MSSDPYRCLPLTGASPKEDHGHTKEIRVTYCAFVPPNPKLLILDLKGCPGGTEGHGFKDVGTSRFLYETATLGFKVLKCWFGGIKRFCIASVAFNSPAIPAQPSVCPMIVLIEPTKSL